MKLFVGLGNPGAKYARNRHNIGFMALDRIAADHGFSPWRSKFQGETAEGRLGTEKVLLLKPATYMNLSGQSVGEALRFYRLDPGDVTVFHDELDLAPGKLRLKTGGGHAGHNGLRSMHQHIGEAYHRVRIGIGHPGDKNRVSGYVLADFAKADEEWIDDLLRGISDGAPELASGAGDKFQTAVARRTAPARNSGTAPTRGAKPETATRGAKPDSTATSTAPRGAGTPGAGAPHAARHAAGARNRAADKAAKAVEAAPDSPLAQLLKKFGKDR